MQSTNYSCGPAALATVLNNLGINTTEQELKVLAGTDTSGTSMYGLVHAAQSKGFYALGIRLSIDELRKNMLVHVIKNGTPHISVVREVTNESVKLADPSLGNIEMSIEKFNEIYSGHALVISDPNTQTSELNYTTTRVSVATNGTESGGDGRYIDFSSAEPSISSDGRYIAFSSSATNLVVNDNNGRRDVFVHDRLLNTTTLVSVSSAGVQGNASSKSPSISADGRYVAFISYATNLVANDTDTFNDVFVRDLLLNTTTMVSVFDADVRVKNKQPSISADGRYIAFSSYIVPEASLHSGYFVYDGSYNI
ncbi:MAG: cysteine peptidase family C39 domain-containing protein [Methanobacteriaceae archaeon]|jgi:predicted double-glycine peptidase